MPFKMTQSYVLYYVEGIYNVLLSLRIRTWIEDAVYFLLLPDNFPLGKCFIDGSGCTNLRAGRKNRGEDRELYYKKSQEDGDEGYCRVGQSER